MFWIFAEVDEDEDEDEDEAEEGFDDYVDDRNFQRDEGGLSARDIEGKRRLQEMWR